MYVSTGAGPANWGPMPARVPGSWGAGWSAGASGLGQVAPLSDRLPGMCPGGGGSWPNCGSSPMVPISVALASGAPAPGMGVAGLLGLVVLAVAGYAVFSGGRR